MPSSRRRSKAPVRDRSLVGIAGSNPAGDTESPSLVSAVCCQVQFSEMGLSLFQGSPAECLCVGVWCVCVCVCVCVVWVCVCVFVWCVCVWCWCGVCVCVCVCVWS